MTETSAPIRIVYLAAVRERAGRAEELVSPPPDTGTVGELLRWLRERGGREAAALDAPAALRCAVNQRLARDRSPVRPGDEVAFFPPMTGG